MTRSKLDRYDARKIEAILKTLNEVYDYNYIPSSPLTKKLETIRGKIERLLQTELEPGLQEEYEKGGKV